MTLPSRDVPVELSLELVGVADWAAGADADRFVFLDAGQLDRLADGRTQLWVALDAGADAAEVAAAVARLLPGAEGVAAADAAALAGDAQAEAMGFLQPLLLVFAAVALVVASFLIVNTFSILVAQRTRELGLLRALGASAGQVRRQVVGEALVTGNVGSAFGVLAGWGLALLALRVTGGAGVLEPTASDVGVALGLGIVVTLVASLVPAHRACRTAPVVALTGRGAAAGSPGAFPGGRTPRILGVLPPGNAAGGHRLRHPGLTRLALLNARRTPGRTAATALTLTVGLLLVGMLGVLGASMKATIADRMPDVMVSDYIVMSTTPIPAATVERVARLPQVTDAHAHGMVGAGIGPVQATVTVTDADAWGSALETTLTAGRLAGAAHELVVTQSALEANGWAVGQVLDGVLQGEPVTWTIVGAFAYPPTISAGDFVTPSATLRAAGLPVDGVMLAVGTRDGETPEAMAALQGALRGVAGASVIDVAEYNRVAGAQVDLMMAGVYALIGMSVLIAALGIVNTLGLSVLERSRELGLLRAVGMTRGQVFGLVGREALLVSVLGGGAGLGLGVLAGVGLQRLISDQLTVLAIPWGLVGVVLATTVAIGLLASLAPAARAARTDVLQALAA